MLSNHFKIAWRSITKNRTSSFINIGGLAVGMAVAFLIGLWIYDELSFYKTFKNYDRIAQVMEHHTENGNTFTSWTVPLPLGKELQNSYGNNFKYVVLSSQLKDNILSAADRNLSGQGIFMDVDGPRMFSLNMIKGTLDGLKDTHSILLSASTAKAIFGDADHHFLTHRNTSLLLFHA
jgi:putative ABC transport system permease protein